MLEHVSRANKLRFVAKYFCLPTIMKNDSLWKSYHGNFKAVIHSVFIQPKFSLNTYLQVNTGMWDDKYQSFQYHTEMINGVFIHASEILNTSVYYNCDWPVDLSL